MATRKDLIKQYPFINDILDRDPEPLTSGFCIMMKQGTARANDKMSITVEIADCHLMWKQGKNWGLAGNDYLEASNGPHKGLIARRGEHLFSVGKDGSILRQTDWPRSQDEENGQRPIYFRSALSGVAEKLAYLVLVSAYSYHKEAPLNDSPGSIFGEQVTQEAFITIYKAPNCGFGELYRISPAVDFLRLDRKLRSWALMSGDYDMISLFGRVDEICTRFHSEVYLNGMRDILVKSECPEVSGSFTGIKVTVATGLEIEQIILEDSESEIILQYNSGKTVPYVQYVTGTIPQLRKMVDRVVFLWNKSSRLYQEQFEPTTASGI